MQNTITPGNSTVEYRPELIPRRGELVAWALAILAWAFWLALSFSGAPVHIAIPILAGFFTLAGALISLSNWVDRRTVLRLSAEEVEFENGLRNVRLRWEEVQMVHVLPSNLGDKVRVVGKTAFFSFRMLGEVHMHGELKGRMGFAEGESILREIQARARLKRDQKPGEGYFYRPE
jgi:hypothetical protein